MYINIYFFRNFYQAVKRATVCIYWYPEEWFKFCAELEHCLNLIHILATLYFGCIERIARVLFVSDREWKGCWGSWSLLAKNTRLNHAFSSSTLSLHPPIHPPNPVFFSRGGDGISAAKQSVFTPFRICQSRPTSCLQASIFFLFNIRPPLMVSHLVF